MHLYALAWTTSSQTTGLSSKHQAHFIKTVGGLGVASHWEVIHTALKLYQFFDGRGDTGLKPSTLKAEAGGSL